MKNVSTVLSMTDIGEVVTGTIDSITSYLKSKEEQKTERERIEACLNAIVKKMETDQNKFENFMKVSFAEREKLYSRVDKLLNASIEKGDTEMCKLALNFMLKVYEKNPMEGYADALGGVNADLLSAGPKNYLD